jgi:predicted TIM-barrel fold metal-dependent hydrolase
MMRGVRAAGDRRSFISGIGAAGLGALSCSRVGRFVSAFAQTPVVAKTSLIDVHHHFVPPFYLSENRDRIVAAGGGRMNPAFLSWSPEQTLAVMDKHGIATAVLSLSPVAFWYGDREAATRTAHRANEYAADLVRSHTGRFGQFAIIPLPDTEAKPARDRICVQRAQDRWDWTPDQLRRQVVGAWCF